MGNFIVTCYMVPEPFQQAAFKLCTYICKGKYFVFPIKLNKNLRPLQRNVFSVATLLQACSGIPFFHAFIMAVR